MEPKKRGDDISLQPTRKIESMSELAAEALLEHAAPADESGPHADAAALEISRLIEVRSVPPPPMTSSAPAPTRWTRGRIVLALAAGALLLVAITVVVTLLVAGRGR